MTFGSFVTGLGPLVQSGNYLSSFEYFQHHMVCKEST